MLTHFVDCLDGRNVMIFKVSFAFGSFLGPLEFEGRVLRLGHFFQENEDGKDANCNHNANANDNSQLGLVGWRITRTTQRANLS